MGERSVYHDERLKRHRPNVEIVSPAESWPAGFPDLETIVFQSRRALGALCEVDEFPEAFCAFSLNIVIEDDAGIAAINAEQRGKSGPTDVLSFPMFDFPAGPGTRQIDGESLAAVLNAWPRNDPQAPYELGDIVISQECCARQAAEIGHSVMDEFQRLLVHGILHLFGYDHETAERDAVRMREREDRLLAALDD